MKGEEKLWFRLAKKIGGTTVEELKARMLHTEFIRWVKEMQDEDDERDAKDWQIAVVAFEVYLLRHVVSHLFAKSIPKPKHGVKDFLIRFDKKGVSEVTRAKVAEMEALAIARSSGAANLIKDMARPKPKIKGQPLKRKGRNGS